MRIVKASYDILTDIEGDSILRSIEEAGRTCYKSEDKMTDSTAEKFVNNIIERGHESVLEHRVISVRFINDRGVSHEQVRHRLSSFSQESTRYVNYGKDDASIAYIDISSHMRDCIGQTRLHPKTKDKVIVTAEHVEKWLRTWLEACGMAEDYYLKMVDSCCPPELARSVLNNSTKTEIVITANLRQWRTIFKQRVSGKAHPQMREVMRPLLDDLKKLLPVVFDDISYEG